MKHLLLTLALLAPLALAACDNKSDDTTTTGSAETPSAMEPAAGDEAAADATEATDADATAATTDAAEPTTTSDSMTTTTPSGDTVTTTTTTTTESAPAATADANSCGDHSAWVGKKKADIQSEIDALGDKARVLYPDSPATMDYNADRVNVILEKDTDVVTEVRCG